MMGEAPKRIWAAPDTVGGWAEANAGDWPSPLNPMDTEYIRADLAAPKVKPLVWGYHPAGQIAADNLGMAYIIGSMGGRPYFLKWPHGVHPDVEDVAEAKAVAQADYEVRVLAALEGGDA